MVLSNPLTLSEFLIFIIGSIWFMMPAYFANMIPPLLKKVKILNYPVDNNLRFRDRPVLGKNKTWRGLVFGVLGGTIIFYIQVLLFQYSSPFSIVDYSQQTILLGFLLSFGALLGDMVESFFKRQKKHHAGQSWMPWDQLDFVIGALILSQIVLGFSLIRWLVILLVSPFLHVLINRLAYILKLQKNKY